MKKFIFELDSFECFVNETTLNFITGAIFRLLGWSLECLCDWKPFVSLSVSSTLLSICEWTTFEIGTIALGESQTVTAVLVIFC